jgi:hypothetical protein
LMCIGLRNLSSKDGYSISVYFMKGDAKTFISVGSNMPSNGRCSFTFTSRKFRQNMKRKC